MGVIPDDEMLAMMAYAINSRHRPLHDDDCEHCLWSAIDQDGMRVCMHPQQLVIFVGDGDTCEHYHEG